MRHLKRGRSLKCSVATVYLDTEAAYCRITRQLAFGNLSEDDSVVRVCRHFGLDAADIEEMMQQVLSGGMGAETCLPDTTRHNIKDFHLGSWFVSAYADGTRLVQTETGSGPGESCSDIVFGWVYSRILSRITEIATVLTELLDHLLTDIRVMTVSFQTPLGPMTVHGLCPTQTLLLSSTRLFASAVWLSPSASSVASNLICVLGPHSSDMVGSVCQTFNSTSP